MENSDEKLFKGKTYSDLLGEIYDNQKRRERQISALIKELQPLVADIGDATLVVPLIKEYLDLAIKNDEHLIKMATIIQRAMNNSASSNPDGGFSLSSKEKQELLQTVKDYNPPKEGEDDK